MSSAEVVAELKNIPISSLNTHVDIIECSEDTKLKDVVTILVKNNISSCPVRKLEYKDRNDVSFSEAYLGLVDILDIVAFVIEMNKTVGKWGPGFEAVLETLIQFSEHSVADVINSGPGIAFQSVPSTANVHDCLVLLGKDRFHRVVVLDAETNRMTQIITQSSMARYLASIISQSDVLSAFVTKSLTDLNLGKIHRVISLQSNAKAIDAFNVIQRSRVTGVPVVDASGTLVGNLSARDIRSLVGSPDKFDRLFDTLAEFLEGIQTDRDYNNGYTTINPSPQTATLSSGAFGSAVPQPQKVKEAPKTPGVFTVDWNDSLSTTLQQLVSKKVHRTYLVDTERHPTGVVTLTDIMRVFSEGKGNETGERRGSLHTEYTPSN